MAKRTIAHEKKPKPVRSNKSKRAELQTRREANRKGEERERRETVPRGAVAADRTKQVRNNSYSPPPAFYVDQPFDCRDCGKAEVWTATQQKWYFEVAKGSLYGRAVRCRACRQKRKRVTGEQAKSK